MRGFLMPNSRPNSHYKLRTTSNLPVDALALLFFAGNDHDLTTPYTGL